MTQDYELKLSNGKVVTWNGTSGEEAARRYVATHPDCKIVATRPARRHGVFAVNVSRIRIIP